MSMEKRGVTEGEGEEPVTGGITRKDLEDAVKVPGRQKEAREQAQHQSAGEDPLSWLSDEAAKKSGKG